MKNIKTINKKRKSKLFGNKKGLFSGLAEFVTGIVQFIKDTLPKPILFLLFLMILLFVGSLLTYFFNFIGIFCNTADQPVKLESNIFSNIALIGDIPDPALAGLEAIETEDIIVSSNSVDSCSRRINNGIQTDEQGVSTIINNPTWYYDGRFCTSCDVVNIQEKSENNITLNTYNLCEGNVYRKNKDDKSLTQKLFCDTITIGCQPPTNYYYNPILNVYLCDGEVCAGKTIGDQWNDKLEEKGARPLYQEIEGTKNPEYTKLIGITCEEFKPNLSVFGIKVFDYKIWVVLLIIIMLFWGLSKANDLK